MISLSLRDSVARCEDTAGFHTGLGYTWARRGPRGGRLTWRGPSGGGGHQESKWGSVCLKFSKNVKGGRVSSKFLSKNGHKR